MTLTEDAWDVFREEGLTTLLYRAIRFGYNRQLRPYLPTTEGFVEKNGVRVAHRHLFDSIVPFQTFPTEDPNHEAAYIDMIREHVDDSESVVVIGGGWGVSTVIAAQRVGTDGEVTCFEGSETMARRTNSTVRLNGVDKWTDVIHAIVSEDVRLERDRNQTDVPLVVSEDLPDCDVLLVDCDGCERALLSAIVEGPDRIILEHHGVYDGNEIVEYQPDVVREQLESLGYEILDTNVTAMESEDDQFGEEQTIFVAQRR